MAEINTEKLKKYKLGELSGNIALAFCGAVLLYFAVAFSIARVHSIKPLETAVLISAPILMLAGAAAAAYCNLKYGAAINSLIKKYVLETCVENAALLHPEKLNLTFNLSLEGNSVILQTEGANRKERLVFDFSAFGRLGFSRKVACLNEIENRLIITFCRLYDRGSKYNDVCFTERAETRRKSGKPVYIIKGGTPDRNAYKTYLKN
ncbi:MAG: hypothetical protein K2I30_00055 [Clostridia bacterium]|nr:hypothetical protein [Clostridia bacterium]